MNRNEYWIRPFDHPHRKPEPLINEYIIGFDCGQARDFSALSIIHEVGIHYEAVHLERLPLDMPYPKQVEYIFNMMCRKPLAEAKTTLCIDYTGVGRPVVDLAEDRGLRPIGVAISSGNSANWNEDRTRVSVPKRDLVNILQIYAQNDRLKVAPNLKFGPTLIKELETFKIKIDPKTAHDSYGSWREGEHDDLVLATAIALWCGEHKNENARLPGPFIRRLDGSAKRRR